MSDRPVHTVEVPLSDGSDEFVRVQIREVDEALVRVGRGGRSIARAERSFGQMLDTVRPVAESFAGRFRGLANAPDEITLEFGVSLSAEADVVIASTATAANFSVSLTWNRSDAGDSNGDTVQGS
ncbi:CU044_2847 family protein [Streptomyces sp. HNM0663]|uniref:CU044_2847 family protein n=1 Tax=Streptomyces chengmaiensis TaxID=3040919 RepID=A0ABT6HPH8_9ACTN|nr:CU044_2847 family protein [Streptomyces chengmaiensis]MDH2390628.1 CU044_2847 family protein [Streptomyces chengmaiensis]